MLKRLSQINQNRLRVANSIMEGPFEMSKWDTCVAGHCHKVIGHKFDPLYCQGRGGVVFCSKGESRWEREAAEFLGLSTDESLTFFWQTEGAPATAEENARRLRELVETSVE